MISNNFVRIDGLDSDMRKAFEWVFAMGYTTVFASNVCTSLIIQTVKHSSTVWIQLTSNEAAFRMREKNRRIWPRMAVVLLNQRETLKIMTQPQTKVFPRRLAGFQYCDYEMGDFIWFTITEAEIQNKDHHETFVRMYMAWIKDADVLRKMNMQRYMELGIKESVAQYLLT